MPSGDPGPSLPHPLTGAVVASPVPPGTGWPEDPADADTPVAADATAVARLAAGCADLDAVDARSSMCRACPRLVAWREEVARQRRRAFAAEPYWGRPIPGWGDVAPWLLVLGLAPAAHGGNRTGRIFTGDRSGDWIFAALHRAGLASQPTSVSAGDGQRLTGVRMVAPVRCAPPANRPDPAERAACAGWLDREVDLLRPGLRVILALGGIAWNTALAGADRWGWRVPRPRPRFGHGVEAVLHPGTGTADPSGTGTAGVVLLGCYHVSQQNTFTGRLTEAMLDDVLARAGALAGTDR